MKRGLLCLGLAIATAVVAAADVEVPGRGGRFPAEAVTAIYQDRAGFLWIGSREGLYLWDGYGFWVFDHDVADPGSIADNDIRTIFEDREGRLWIATNTGGLNRLDRATGTFEHFRHDSADPSSISYDSVYGIAQDREGKLWVGTQIGLNRFDPETGTFERFLADPSDSGSLSHDYVYPVYTDRAGDLWIGTVGGGLNRYDPDTGTFEVFRHDPQQPGSLASDRVFALLEDDRDRLWIGTGTGLDRWDPASGAFVHVDHPELDGVLVTSITFRPPGTLWLGTFGEGVIEYEIDSGRLQTHASVGSTDAEDRVVSVYTDRQRTVWIGTWEHGLQRVGAAAGLFETIEGSYPEATTVVEDGEGRLWVGTWAHGIDRRDPGRSALRRYYRDLTDGDEFIATVLTAHEGRDGSIWAGTMEGAYRIDPEDDSLTAWHHDPADPAGLGPGYVTAIHQDADGALWIGVGGSGLYRLRPDGTGFDRFVHDPDDPASLSDDYITGLLDDPAGTLWVATRSGGLNAMDPASGRCRRYLPDRDDPGSIGHHYVTALLDDGEGGLWIGTGGGGVGHLVDGTFERFTEADGLLDDNVMALALDDDGSLWLGTKRGLTRLDPASRRVVNYDVGQGFPGAVFHPGGAASGRDRLYFATRRGVVGVPRGTPFPEPQPSPALVTAVFTPEGPLVGDPWQAERVEVPWGEVLTLEFAVLDYGDTDRHAYAYRIENLRDEWVDLGRRREITFTDLGPGTYRLFLRGRNVRGVWSEPPAPLTIEVVPPFWMTGWFRFLAFAVLVLAVFTGHRIRTAALERRNKELLALKEERERAHEQLRKLTRGLEAAKEDERKRIARELHDEMGQALTAAKINLQLLPGVTEPDERVRRIEETVDLVDRMIGNVRQLSLDLRPPLLDELGLVPAVRGYLEAVAQRSGIAVDVEADRFQSGLTPEIEIAGFRIVQEAVNNVVRHAEASRIGVELRRRNGSLAVRVRDDGKGFDLDEVWARAAAGRHLGLAGIRERVEALGGEVVIQSVRGRGTEVRARVPLEGATR